MKKINTQWQKAQETIFVDWINNTLSPDVNVTCLGEDLKDGIILMQLVEKLSGKKSPQKLVQHPRFKIQKISNCSNVLKFVEQEFKIKPLCSAENIVNGGGEIKFLLGLLFQVFMMFHKSDLLAPQNTEKQQNEIILKWLTELLYPYQLVLSSIDKMMENFYNGKILVALLDLFFEQNTEFYKYMMSKGDGERIGLSMRMAHDLLGVSEVLTTEDVIAKNIDFRVFYFYFDFLMNAFKNKSTIMDIDLIQLVEQALQQLNGTQQKAVDSKQADEKGKQERYDEQQREIARKREAEELKQAETRRQEEDHKKSFEEKVEKEEYVMIPRKEDEGKQLCKFQSDQNLMKKKLPPIPTRRSQTSLAQRHTATNTSSAQQQKTERFKPIVLKDVMCRGSVGESVKEPSREISDKKGDLVPLRFTNGSNTERSCKCECVREQQLHPSLPSRATETRDERLIKEFNGSSEISLQHDDGYAEHKGLFHRHRRLYGSDREIARTEAPTRTVRTTTHQERYTSNGRNCYKETYFDSGQETVTYETHETIVFGGFWLI
ncbi:hypothetical protein EIN_022850 [Entamoeba invadens IP1]|uniref:hypothetical protein n=1 Tax=Entamoeba invadens IP1 TaxID=370355 RepID=UPI0002C3F1EA|nr:hypothetical protein EIN_022850 [Entamoeba invadens IP1]ELP90646.1 hypothetical protein EIN_022850 [Entamoeba invadens IP1]|eukprot:XP_004257417.1 hypothetical protein EIN_022850 [Entamoeba invadens IP1]